MEEQAQSASIKDRIARMNLEEVHAPTPGIRPSYTFDQAPAKKRPPPPPPRPQAQLRQQTVNSPPIFSNASALTRQGNQPNDEPIPPPRISPALPPRPPPRSSSQRSPALPPRSSPALPPRKPSSQNLQRRDSSESISTIASGISAYSLGSAASNGEHLYTIRAPAYDPSKLPVLPPKKAAEPPKKDSATLRAMRSTSSDRPDKRVLPPMLPSRPTAPVPTRQESKAQEYLHPHRSQVFPSPRLSAISLEMNASTEAPPHPPIPGRSWSTGNGVPQPGAPPPIPMASRPNLSAIMASKPLPGATGSCLKCRDFSGPDGHASRFPRETIPSSEVGWLAVQLTSPFPSATDKARAIFTWLHHNVDYDVHSFFSGNISPSTPERTLRSGLAVCEGYAGLFCALALKAGLECIVVSGDGKGYGHKPLDPREPLPPMSSNHAWNAVRIDNGEWKLIDACWGAGVVNGANAPYTRHFSEECFTMDNDEFGLKHFPMDDAYFFRCDGRPSISWEEYQMNDVVERLTVYSNAIPDHGLGVQTFFPAAKEIKVFDPHSSPDMRFQFSFKCPHWDNERLGKGKPYVMVLHVGGRDGRKSDYVPFETDGKVWWLVMDRSQLGAPGQKVSVYAVNSFNNRDARGLTYSEFKTKKGRCAMGFSGIAMWELV